MMEGEARSQALAVFDVLDLARLIRGNIRVLVAYMTIFVMLAVAYSLLANRYYRSEVVLSPASSDASSSATQSIIGSLGAFSGVLGNPGQRMLSQTIAILESRSFTVDFLNTSNALPILLPEYWDDENQAWQPMGPGKLSGVRKILGVARPERDAQTRRSDEAFRRFSRLRSVAMDNNAQLVTLSIAWRDPDIAAEWANSMVSLLNEHTRERKIQESKMNIQYLRAQIESTNIVSAREALYGLLEQELRTSMIANVRREYALQVIDPAVPADRAFRPQPLLAIFLAALGGVVVGVLHLLLSVYLRHLADAKLATR